MLNIKCVKKVSDKKKILFAVKIAFFEPMPMSKKILEFDALLWSGAKRVNS